MLWKMGLVVHSKQSINHQHLTTGAPKMSMNVKKPSKRHKEPERLCNFQQKIQKRNCTLQNIPKCWLREWPLSSSVLHQCKTMETKSQSNTWTTIWQTPERFKLQGNVQKQSYECIWPEWEYKTKVRKTRSSQRKNEWQKKFWWWSKSDKGQCQGMEMNTKH